MRPQHVEYLHTANAVDAERAVAARGQLVGPHLLVVGHEDVGLDDVVGGYVRLGRPIIVEDGHAFLAYGLEERSQVGGQRVVGAPAAQRIHLVERGQLFAQGALGGRRVVALAEQAGQNGGLILRKVNLIGDVYEERRVAIDAVSRTDLAHVEAQGAEGVYVAIDRATAHVELATDVVDGETVFRRQEHQQAQLSVEFVKFHVFVRE